MTRPQSPSASNPVEDGLVERLTARFPAEGWTKERGVLVNPDGPEAADRISALQADVERLKGLVKRAYIEGHRHGRANPPVYQSAEEDWAQCRSRAALQGNQEEQA